jgi:hypothetical protein
VEQTFKGFTVRVRYLRLYIVDNHGGSSINFQGIQLHGADCRVAQLMERCGKRHLTDAFIDKVSCELCERDVLVFFCFYGGGGG